MASGEKGCIPMLGAASIHKAYAFILFAHTRKEINKSLSGQRSSEFRDAE